MLILISNQCPYGNSQAWPEGNKIREVCPKPFKMCGTFLWKNFSWL